MELKDFIAKSITDICLGIRDAQRIVNYETGNVPIAPAFMDGKSILKNVNDKITFDVSVSVSKGSKKGGNGGIKVTILGAEVNGEMSSETASMNRIQFSVPFYPQALSAYEKKEGKNEI